MEYLISNRSEFPTQGSMTLRSTICFDIGEDGIEALPVTSPTWKRQSPLRWVCLVLQGDWRPQDGLWGNLYKLIPGSEYIYSNIGFLLLGMIVEQQSGQPLIEFLREGVFGPIGILDCQLIHGPNFSDRARSKGALVQPSRASFAQRILPSIRR